MKRGNLLWTGSRMMLSEHRQLLNQRLEQPIEDCDVERVNDEQQLDEWEELLARAINDDIEVKISFINCDVKDIIGKIIDCDSELGFLYLKLKNEEIKKISVKDIKNFI